jgi:hypothetical protein
MQGYYEIEKYKAELVDGEWIPIELIETRIEKNNVNIAARLGANGGSVGVCAATNTNDDGYPTFTNNQRLFICSIKVYSKSWKNNAIDYTSSSEDTNSPILGGQTSGKEEPTFVLGSPNTITTEARWNPPTSQARTIYTIGCFYLRSRNNPISSVTLNVPCVQETNELLIIKYRYNWYDDSSDLYTSISDPTASAFISKRQAMASDYANPYSEPNAILFSSFDITVNSDAAVNFSSGDVTLPDGDKRNYSEGYSNHIFSATNSDHIGRLFNTAQPYNNNTYLTMVGSMPNTNTYRGNMINLYSTKVRRPLDTTINSTFHKALGSDQFAKVPTPFLDTDLIGNGLGRAVLSDDLSSGNTSYVIKNGFAELFRTHIVDSGAIGTSTYKISKKLITGFRDQNSWISRTTARMNFVTDSDSDYTKNNDNTQPKDTGLIADRSDFTNIGWYIGQYSLPEYISVNSKPSGRNAVFVRSIHAIDEDDYLEWSAGTTPSLPVTEIKCVEGFLDGTIVVACGDTGLWKIERNIGDAASSATITHIQPTGLVDNAKCQAFDANSPSHTGLHGTKWWALFSTELAYSTDQGSNWTVLNASTTPKFVLTGIDDADGYNKLVGMHVDSVHEDERMCFLSSTKVYTDDGTYSSAVSTVIYPVAHWWSVGGSSSASDESTSQLDNSGARFFLYPLHGNNAVHAILGTDSWVILDDVATWGTTTNTNRSSLTNSSSPTCFTYDAELEQYLYYITARYSSPNLFTENGRKGRALNNIESYITGTPDNVKIFTQDETSYTTCNFISIGGGLTIIRSDRPVDDNTFIYGEYGTVSGMYIFDHSVGDPLGLGNNDAYISGADDAWAYYGWNGSAWVRDHAGTKSTHSDKEETIDGLSIQFFDLDGSVGSSTAFVADDIFDTYVYDGIVKDDTTEFSTELTVMFGAGAKGTGTFPTTVPNPIGVTTMPYAFESHLQIDNGENCKLVAEIDYIGTYSGDTNNESSVGLPSDGMVIGADLDGDFVIDFGMSCSYYPFNMPTNLSNIYKTYFGLITKSSISTTESNEADFGVLIQYDNDYPDRARIKILTIGSEVDVDVTDFDPINDEYQFSRVGDTLILNRNGGLIHTFGTNISGVLKGTIKSNTDYYSLNIWNATVTFDDIRHVVKVGDGTDTGAFDPNFAKLSYEYFSASGEILLDGVKANILPSDGVSLPTAGTVYICRGTGELSFNSADVGKAITASWMIIPKVNDSKI